MNYKVYVEVTAVFTPRWRRASPDRALGGRHRV